MIKQSKYKKVILLELEQDLADWLKLLLEKYVLSAKAYPTINMQDQLNAQLIVGKIIRMKYLASEKEKGRTVRLSGSLSDYDND